MYYNLFLNILLTYLYTLSVDAQTDDPVKTNTTVQDDDSAMAAMGPEIHCKFQSLTRICGEKVPSRGYYYDMQLQECTATTFGHCKNAYNNFKSKSECKSTCGDLAHHLHPKDLSEGIACRLQPEFGDCHQYHPRFYFDINTSECKGFSYSGCGGNYNRFPSSKVCKAVCIPLIHHEEE